MADLIHLPPGVGVDDAIVILNRVALAKVFIVTGPARPDGLRVRGRRGEIQTLLIIDDSARIAVDAVPCILCPFVTAICRADNLRRDVADNGGGGCQSVSGYRSDACDTEAAVQVFPLDASIIRSGSAPTIPGHAFGVRRSQGAGLTCCIRAVVVAVSTANIVDSSGLAGLPDGNGINRRLLEIKQFPNLLSTEDGRTRRQCDGACAGAGVHLH